MIVDQSEIMVSEEMFTDDGSAVHRFLLIRFNAEQIQDSSFLGQRHFKESLKNLIDNTEFDQVQTISLKTLNTQEE